MNQPAKISWWKRNWKWAAPSFGLAALALFASFIALVLSLVFGLMKSSDPYKQALAKARESAPVQAALGTPIHEGWFTTGSISFNGPTGRARLAIPVSGPQGRATIHVNAVMDAGVWTYRQMIVQTQGPASTIDLLEATAEPALEKTDRGSSETQKQTPSPTTH